MTKEKKGETVMKSILSVFVAFLIFIAFTVDSSLFAQDSTRTQSKQKIKNQIKHQEGEQVKVKKGKAIEENDVTKDDTPENEADKTRKGEEKNTQGLKTREENKQKGFKDDDGDGVNDNALDDDGDGIPNGQDPDYTQSKDRNTHQKMKNTEIKMQNKKAKSKSIQNK